MLKQNIWEDLNTSLFKIKDTKDGYRKQVDCLDTYLEAVRNSLQNILKVSKYEMVGRPEFGCDLSQFLFNQLDVENRLLIEEYIKTILLKYEPRINTHSIDIIESKDYNAIFIDIKFRIRNDPNKNEFSERVSFCCP